MSYMKSMTAVAGPLAAAWMTVAAAAPAGETKHASGISLVGPGPYQPRPANEAQRAAYHRALRAAQSNPDALGYPWLDSQGRLVQRNTSPQGLELAEKLGAAIPGRTEPAELSYKQLEDIKNEIIFLDRAGVKGAEAIWKTQPDEEHNRIIVTVSKVDDALMAHLARVYGTRALAVHVKPSSRQSGLVRYSMPRRIPAGPRTIPRADPDAHSASLSRQDSSPPGTAQPQPVSRRLFGITESISVPRKRTTRRTGRMERVPLPFPERLSIEAISR